MTSPHLPDGPGPETTLRAVRRASDPAHNEPAGANMLNRRPPIPAAFISQVYPLWVVWYSPWNLGDDGEFKCLIGIEDGHLFATYPDDSAELIIGWEVAEEYVPVPVCARTGQSQGLPLIGMTPVETVGMARDRLKADRDNALAIWAKRRADPRRVLTLTRNHPQEMR